MRAASRRSPVQPRPTPARLIGGPWDLDLSGPFSDLPLELPMGLPKRGPGCTFQQFVPNREERPVVQFHRTRVTQVAGGAVPGEDQRLRPSAPVILAEAGLVPERGTAMAVSHQ